jgi:hypothetical protein
MQNSKWKMQTVLLERPTQLGANSTQPLRVVTVTSFCILPFAF